MNLSVEISCDLSGLSEEVNGENIVARLGARIDHNNKNLNQDLNNFIRTMCREDNKNIFNVISLYQNNGVLILTRKTNVKVSYGQACSQVSIALKKPTELKSFLTSPYARKFLYEKIDFGYYATEFLKNQEIADLSLERDLLVKKESISKGSQTNYYISGIYDNVFISSTCSSEKCMQIMSTEIHERKKQSLLTGDLESLEMKNILKELSAKTKIFNNEPSITEAKNEPSSKLIDRNELIKLLEVINSSIESNSRAINTVRSVDTQKKGLLVKKTIMTASAEVIIRDSLNNIEDLISAQHYLIQKLFD